MDEPRVVEAVPRYLLLTGVFYKVRLMTHKPNQPILDALARNDGCEALRLAAAFPHLGTHKDAIQRGWQACSRPDFYRQIGKDPEQLIAVGVAAVRARYAS